LGIGAQEGVVIERGPAAFIERPARRVASAVEFEERFAEAGLEMTKGLRTAEGVDGSVE
jgi:hypothetical protein